ncbi:hypothetical protein GPECTOR_13g768 [Gonium pectorale]|uniref:Glycosyltransferase family 32 protein n=1 Tax=Gonium pectorale TaxID=33097 RepID=A0A150GNB2_GONPE|nr:hypothetical protein GPECTOR_13g768 [Gonium pectorale]|eukprot:KXZ51281.1 hypothetical protein GPECTOR_13g768 [Gonium pectorale]
MHENVGRLSELQARLRARCQELHPHWRFIFWDDAAVDTFVRLAYPWYHKTWTEIEPPIKRIDTSRYMLMHHYGGVYLDVDVECVNLLDSLVDPLPPHSTWVGDYPEPMFLASAPRNDFWLHALHRISRVWREANAWHSTGPQGLNAALREWVLKHGSGVLVPFITQRTEPAFHEWIKNKNNTVPWYELSDMNWQLDSAAAAASGLPNAIPAVWISSTGHSKFPPGSSPGPPAIKFSSPADVSPNMRVGFLANELLDPPGCGGPQLEACRNGWCNTTWPHAYVVHHCMSTWRGRIGESRRRRRRRRRG